MRVHDLQRLLTRKLGTTVDYRGNMKNVSSVYWGLDWVKLENNFKKSQK